MTKLCLLAKIFASTHMSRLREKALAVNVSNSAMGRGEVCCELDKPNDFKKDVVVWNYCVEGGEAEFMENLQGSTLR